MKTQAIGFFAVLSTLALAPLAAEATSYKVPVRPVMSVVMCEGTGLNAVVTAHSPTQAKLEGNTELGNVVSQVKAESTDEVITFTSESAMLVMDLNRVIPGTQDFQGELTLEVDGQRVSSPVACHGVFTATKAPSLRVWQ